MTAYEHFLKRIFEGYYSQAGPPEGVGRLQMETREAVATGDLTKAEQARLYKLLADATGTEHERPDKHLSSRLIL